MGSGLWPQFLLGILIVLIALNIFNSIRKYRKEENKRDFSISFHSLFTNKLVIGSIIIGVYSLILDYFGYLLSTILFIFLYMTLLSEKRLVFKIVTSLVATLVIYIIFARVLQVPLPRGIGILRDFALLLETL